MRILLLTQVLPYPPHSGPRIKTWNLIKYLSSRHEVTLVSFVRDESAADVDALRRHCHAVHTLPIRRGRGRDVWYLLVSLLTGQPLLMARDHRRAMRRLVETLAQNGGFDVVHADQLNMVQYAERVPASRRILDAHNALWVLYRRLAAITRGPLARAVWEREWRRLKIYEGVRCRRADAVLAVSREDREALLEAAGGAADVAVMPIAVDIEEITPVRRVPDADRVVHLGTMYWPPNVDGVRWFLDAVWPLVLQRRPAAQLDVIGASPPTALRRIGERLSGVHVHGYVADPTDHLRRAGLLIVPLHAGGGMRVKILTALAQALPVVSTSLGSEGLRVEDGRHLLVADTAPKFAEAVLRLLDDRALADRLGREGRRLIESRYDYRTVYQEVEVAYTGHRNHPANREPP